MDQVVPHQLIIMLMMMKYWWRSSWTVHGGTVSRKKVEKQLSYRRSTRWTVLMSTVDRHRGRKVEPWEINQRSTRWTVLRDTVDRPRGQRDRLQGDEETVDRDDNNGRPSPRQKGGSEEPSQTVDPVDRSTDGGRPSSSQQPTETLGRGQRERRPNVRLADYVTHVACPLTEGNRASHGNSRPSPSFPLTTGAFRYLKAGQPSGISTPAHTNPPKPPDNRAVNSLPVVRLTNAEKAERGKKGLCWFCEEKWDPTHHCKRRFLALMGPDDEDMAAGAEPDEHPITEDLVITGDISSLHSLAGSPSPRSLRLTGNINNSPVHVLLDGGSTHNFIHPTVAEKLSLVLYPVPPFRVYVGNGESLRCSYSCPQTAVALQGHIFAIDLYLLEIHGPEVVLGVQWLQTLGKVSHDYANLTMEFTWNGATVQLRGDAPAPKPISYGHLCSLVATQQPLEFYELVPAPPDTLPASAAPEFPSDVPASITTILQTHAAIFATPTTLPPARDTAYHPQTDGQTEVTNRGLEQYLRAFTFDRPTKWAALLPWAELALNCSRHEGLKVSPFQALYGREPPHVFATPSVRSKVPVIEEILIERAVVLEELKDNLRRVQQRMRASANMHRRDVSFQVGDLVLLKLQPYRQHSVAKPKSAKLARRYYGPFEVVERVGQVAYRLRLPEGCRIHDVFHVSLLRPFVTPATGVPTPTWPEEFVQNHPLSVPVAALRSRTILVDGDPQEQWLIRRSDDTDDDSTWEPVHMLRDHFPTLRLEDKANSDSGGVDTGLEHATHNVDEEPEEPESPRVKNKMHAKFGVFLFLTVSLFTILTPPQVAAEYVPPPANLVVGSGPGNIRTITEAIAIAAQTRDWRQRFVIKIMAGVYNENVVIDSFLPDLTLVGEGKGVTIITGQRSVYGFGGGSTFHTATFAVDAIGFVAWGITFQNTAGRDKGPAVAVRVRADQVAFHECSIEGYQDTLYLFEGRQFYKKCDIYGTIDFIFGNGKAVFQDCNIYARNPGLYKDVVITASKREGPTEDTGIVIQSSWVTTDPAEDLRGTEAYLGRPWGTQSRTVFIETTIDSFINPAGWEWWDGRHPSLTSRVYYAEYGNKGPGSGTAGRVRWDGFHQLTTPGEVLPFTVGVFLDGDSWLPFAGVPYRSGL
ncbi:unnamed protein product [Cuscuta campestris]|uniref:pectinesterase n=1 Tax=Cuscuta campestris TaxID=132261 RepID=A0A484NGV0_9ASTE|nr:unnamed protein product [Cuscuta campestris]